VCFLTPGAREKPRDGVDAATRVSGFGHKGSEHIYRGGVVIANLGNAKITQLISPQEAG
jgi:hypothetical protein